MKKSVLLSGIAIIGLLTSNWIVFGNDCSYYQDLITYYENSIKEYQDLAAGYSASIASQMSAQGLGYTAIASASSANPYASTINDLEGKLLKAKTDYTNCKYSSSSNSSSSNYSYDSIMNSQKALSYAQKAMDYVEYQGNAYAKQDYKNAIKNAEKAIENLKKASDYDDYREEALFIEYGELGWLYCLNSEYSKGKTYLKKSYNYTKDSDTKELYNSCLKLESYNSKSSSSSTTSTTSKSSCNSYGPNAYSSNGYCYCKEGYERNYNKNRCVASRTNPNYGGTDFRSAKDGGDYINMLLDFEDYVSCLNDGMSPINHCEAYNGAKCICKECEDGYKLSSNGTACMLTDKTCQGWYGKNSYAGNDNLCYCKTGYTWNKEETSCVTLDESCKTYFGEHSIGDPSDLDNCFCEEGYEFNSDNTKCIKESSNNNSVSNNVIYNNGFSQEYNNAYKFAFANKITTMPTIEQANMNGEIIRAEIAKMLANWVKSLGYTPDTSKSCKFNDISSVKGDLYTAIIESCQLGIMGQGISDFRPYDKITKGEVSTAVSRILRGGQFEGGDPYYTLHMNALKTAGILDNVSNPGLNELRGNVMVMLMRASDSDELVNCDDPVTILACEVEPSQCPKACLEEDEEIDVDALVEAILSEQEEESVKDKSGDLIITISKNTNGKIVSEGESKLDKIKFKADDEDIKLVSLVFEYYGYVSPDELHFVRLEDKNGNRISDMGSIDNNGQIKLRLEKDYVDIKKGKTLEVTLVVSGKFKSGETLGLKLVDLLASAQNIDLNGEPSTYK